jgi:hypothetical protein
MRELNEEEQRKLAEELSRSLNSSPTPGDAITTEKRHEFDKEMVDFNLKFEEQIEKHVNANAYTDRKWSGSVIGTSVVGGMGFLVFQGTLVFGISGSMR